MVQLHFATNYKFVCGLLRDDNSEKKIASAKKMCYIVIIYEMLAGWLAPTLCTKS
jgi:hypothetical protein